jgi:hypothetical protein
MSYDQKLNAHENGSMLKKKKKSRKKHLNMSQRVFWDFQYKVPFLELGVLKCLEFLGQK